MIALPLQSSYRPELHKAQRPIELVTSMVANQYGVHPITSALYPRSFTRIAHKLIPNCKPGQILDCKASFQMSNRLDEIVELSACLVLTPDATGTAGIVDPFNVSSGVDPSNGRFITPMPGFNVTPNQCLKFPYGGMHHAPFNLIGDCEIPPEYSGDLYVAIIAYASSTAWDYSKTVFIDQNCGLIHVKVFR